MKIWNKIKHNVKVQFSEKYRHEFVSQLYNIKFYESRINTLEMKILCNSYKGDDDPMNIYYNNQLEIYKKKLEDIKSH